AFAEQSRLFCGLAKRSIRPAVILPIEDLWIVPIARRELRRRLARTRGLLEWRPHDANGAPRPALPGLTFVSRRGRCMTTASRLRKRGARRRDRRWRGWPRRRAGRCELRPSHELRQLGRGLLVEHGRKRASVPLLRHRNQWTQIGIRRIEILQRRI